MLEKVDLLEKLDKQAYKQQVEPLKLKLDALQRTMQEKKLPVVVLLEGWDAAGKGEVLSGLLSTLDPRNFKTIVSKQPTEEEARKPFLWRHWATIPQAGRFSIYAPGWYSEIITGLWRGTIKQNDAYLRLAEIDLFERQLTEDGCLVVKIFLHISKQEQRKRLEKLAASKETAWRATKPDFRRNKQYSRELDAFEATLQASNTPYAPWHIISGEHRRTAKLGIHQILVSTIEKALKQPPSKGRGKRKIPCESGDFTLMQMPALKEVPLTLCLPRAEYQDELRRLHKRLGALHNQIYSKKMPVVMAFEGWDAAGKGGCIKRLTAGLDPRGYEVVPIAAPTPPEKERHFLWRFWNALPKTGHIGIFDRSWYGRVLVERVEGFATEAEWKRAYREINEFEAMLADWGAVVLKFWLHIDPEEQLRRFEARQANPAKQWKITDEDWRNREKWPAYEQAVDDMLRLTSTDFAPWTIVETQDKPYGRIKVLQTVVDALERRL